MNLLTIVNTAIVMIGLPTLLVGCIYIGRKLQILDSLCALTAKIKWNLKLIADELIKSEMPFDHTKLQAYSPIQLSEEGKAFIKELKFDQIFAQHKQDFYNWIDSEKPTDKLGIQISAIKSVHILFDKPYFQPVRSYLYNNPKEETVRNTITILGIYVRNQYLQDHPEITD